MKKLVTTLLLLSTFYFIYANNLKTLSIPNKDSELRINSELQTSFENNHYTPKKEEIDITEIIYNYNIPSSIQPFLEISAGIYSKLNNYKEINIYNEGRFKVTINLDYLNPEVEFCVEVEY
jgi:hypothetical protein